MLFTKFPLNEGYFSGGVEDFFHDKKKKRIELAIGKRFNELNGL